MVSRNKISYDLRQTIIDLNENGHRPSAIVKMLPESVDRATVYRIIRNYKLHGTIKDKKRKKSRKFTAEMGRFVDDIYEKDRFVGNIYK